MKLELRKKWTEHWHAQIHRAILCASYRDTMESVEREGEKADCERFDLIRIFTADSTNDLAMTLTKVCAFWAFGSLSTFIMKKLDACREKTHSPYTKGFERSKPQKIEQAWSRSYSASERIRKDFHAHFLLNVERQKNKINQSFFFPRHDGFFQPFNFFSFIVENQFLVTLIFRIAMRSFSSWILRNNCWNAFMCFLLSRTTKKRWAKRRPARCEACVKQLLMILRNSL